MAAESPVALIYGYNGSAYVETTIRAGIAVPSGQPGFLALGSDGTNTRYLSLDANGRVNVNNISGTISLPTGAATETTLSSINTKTPALGQAVMASSSPVVIASNQSAIPINDNAGSLTTDTPQLPAALVGGRLDANVGAWLGSTAPTVGQKTMANSVPVAIASNQSAIPVTQGGSAEVSFTVIGIGVVVGNNKSMLSVWNPTGSGVKIKLREFYIRNPQTSAVTGVAGDFRIYRFAKATAPTGGTALTAVLHDTTDTIAAGIDCRTGATNIGTEEANPLDRMIQSTDDWGPGALDQEGAQQIIANYMPARAKRDPQVKALTINPGQGIHLKFATNSTAGSADIIFVLTQE